LLVTDSDNLHAVSLQVKYGKDFLPEMKAEQRDSLRCASWFTLNRKKVDTSQAQFWVFVLHGFKSDKPDFVVIPTPELQQRMKKIHAPDTVTLQSYFSSTNSNRCWETRGIGIDGSRQIAKGTYECPHRDFTDYLNENGWAAVANKLKS
jgi:hypothetical protein